MNILVISIVIAIILLVVIGIGVFFYVSSSRRSQALSSSTKAGQGGGGSGGSSGGGGDPRLEEFEIQQIIFFQKALQLDNGESITRDMPSEADVRSSFKQWKTKTSECKDSSTCNHIEYLEKEFLPTILDLPNYRNTQLGQLERIFDSKNVRELILKGFEFLNWSERKKNNSVEEFTRHNPPKFEPETDSSSESDSSSDSDSEPKPKPKPEREPEPINLEKYLDYSVLERIQKYLRELRDNSDSVEAFREWGLDEEEPEVLQELDRNDLSTHPLVKKLKTQLPSRRDDHKKSKDEWSKLILESVVQSKIYARMVYPKMIDAPRKFVDSLLIPVEEHIKEVLKCRKDSRGHEVFFFNYIHSVNTSHIYRFYKDLEVAHCEEGLKPMYKSKDFNERYWSFIGDLRVKARELLVKTPDYTFEELIVELIDIGILQKFPKCYREQNPLKLIRELHIQIEVNRPNRSRHMREFIRLIDLIKSLIEELKMNGISNKDVVQELKNLGFSTHTIYRRNEYFLDSMRELKDIFREITYTKFSEEQLNSWRDTLLERLKPDSRTPFKKREGGSKEVAISAVKQAELYDQVQRLEVKKPFLFLEEILKFYPATLLKLKNPDIQVFQSLHHDCPTLNLFKKYAAEFLRVSDDSSTDPTNFLQSLVFDHSPSEKLMTPHEYLVKDIVKPHIWARYQEKDYEGIVVPISQQDFEMWLERMHGRLFREYNYIGRRGIIDLFLVDRFPQTLLASSKQQISYQLQDTSRRAIVSAPRDTRDAIDLDSFYSQFRSYIKEMLGVQDIRERYIVKEANLFKNTGRYFPFYELKSLQELYQEYSRDGQTIQEVKKHFVEVLWRFIPEDYRPQRFDIRKPFVLEKERVKMSTRKLLEINYSQMDGHEYMKPEYRKNLFKFLKKFSIILFKALLSEMEESREDMTMKKYLLQVVKEKYWKDYRRQSLEGLISEVEMDSMIEREEFRELFSLEEAKPSSSTTTISIKDIRVRDIITGIEQDIKDLDLSLKVKLAEGKLANSEFWREVKSMIWMPLRQQVGRILFITEDVIDKWIADPESEEVSIREINGKKRFTLIRSATLLSQYINIFRELKKTEELKKVSRSKLEDLERRQQDLKELLKISSDDEEDQLPLKYKEFVERFKRLKAQQKVVEKYTDNNSARLRYEKNYPLCFLNYKQR